MITDLQNEKFSCALTTYVVHLDDKCVVIENVPARVSNRTGEQLFAPDVVERIHEIVWSQQEPKRIIQAPVYEYAA